MKGANSGGAVSFVQLAILFAALIFLGTVAFAAFTPEHRIVRALSACTVPGHRIDISRACVTEAVARLLNSFSARQILTVAESDRSPEGIVKNCHEISHAIGIELYSRSNDSEQALAQCTQQCGAGCIHGVVGAAVVQELGVSYAEEDLAHLDVKEIEAVGKKYCVNTPALCHSIGHLLYLSTHSVPASVGGCDDIADDASGEKCYRGVFMEAVGGEDSLFRGDNPTSSPQTEFADECMRAPVASRHACFQYLPEYQDNIFEIEKIYDPVQRLQVRLETCGALDGRDRSSCLEGIGYSTSLWASEQVDIDAQRGLCEKLPDKTDRLSCTLGEVSGYIRYERNAEGIAYCDSIADDDQRSLCFNAAFYAFNDFPKKESPLPLCTAQPATSECQSRFATYLSVKDTLPEYRRGLFVGE